MLIVFEYIHDLSRAHYPASDSLVMSGSDLTPLLAVQLHSVEESSMDLPQTYCATTPSSYYASQAKITNDAAENTRGVFVGRYQAIISLFIHVFFSVSCHSPSQRGCFRPSILGWKCLERFETLRIYRRSSGGLESRGIRGNLRR